MARPLRIEYPGAFYHVTSRGNEQKDVFKSQKDREKFLDYLASATERYGAVLHAYCLMTNHYHLLLETPDGNLSQIMRHINGAYTTYFNIKRKRAGHLFQGRYKAILVEFDEYAMELTRYIHLNPVRAGMVALPEEYLWSSYRSYIDMSPAQEWLQQESILAYFGTGTVNTKQRYRIFVEDLLGTEYESPLKETFGTAVLGSEGFVAMIAETQIAAKGKDRSILGLQAFASRPEPDAILSAVSSVMGENKKLARQVGMYLCHRHSGKKLKEIGALFSVGETAIAEARRLLSRKLKEDGQLAKAVETIRDKLQI
jgi:REP element-mobilizing transposase RayT